MAEGARLESVYTGNRIVGSNPTPSASPAGSIPDTWVTFYTGDIGNTFGPKGLSRAHVHVFGQGGEARIVLEGPGGITLDWVAGISRGDVRKLMQEVQREQERLIAMWRTIHER